MQDLAAQIVAQTGDKALIEQQRSEAAAPEPGIFQSLLQLCRIEVWVECIWPQFREERVFHDLIGVQHLNVRGAVQQDVGTRAVDREAE